MRRHMPIFKQLSWVNLTDVTTFFLKQLNVRSFIGGEDYVNYRSLDFFGFVCWSKILIFEKENFDRRCQKFDVKFKVIIYCYKLSHQQ